VLIVGIGALLYFLVFDDDDDASSGGDYCTLLEDNSDIFSDLTTGDTSAEEAEHIVDTIHELREAAPEEVVDEWATLDDPFQAFDQAIEDAGLTWQEVDEMSPEEIPEEVNQAAQDLGEALTDPSLDLSAMAQTLEDHAVEECGIDPSEFGSGSDSSGNGGN
jgi:hypothetical protein